MAKYLVTGGCGFIGANLVESLINEGHQVIVIDNFSTGKRDNILESAKVITADINDQDVLESIIPNIDGCFHLAAIASVQKSITSWLMTHQANQTGLVRIFEIISGLNKKIPVVFVSSAAVYGDYVGVVSENNIPNPMSAYGVDKLSCENHAKIASSIHNIPNIGLRFFNVYGPGQNADSPYSGVVSIFLKNIQNKEIINIYGDGEEIRDFIYVKDVVSALCLSMKKLEENSPQYSGEVYNVSTGKGTSIVTLANIIKEVMDAKNQKINFLPNRYGNIKESVGNAEKIYKELGFYSSYSLEQGLKDMLDYKKVSP